MKGDLVGLPFIILIIPFVIMKNVIVYFIGSFTFHFNLKQMKTIKISAFFLIILFAGFAIFKAIDTGWILNAGFITLALSAFVLIAFIVGLVKLGKWMFAIPFLLLSAASCDHAKSNQQVVVSEDCGVNWRKIPAGSAVPLGTGNYCFMKVIIPNYPMQGEANFITNLKDRVRAKVAIDYDYSITDPLKFIKQAKYLGKSNTSADDEEGLNDKAFEGAENMVIDKRIKDISKGLFLKEDIVEIDQSELENRLLVKANERLEKLGVHLNFITLTFDLDEQTRQAIDIATAMKIYESRGIQDIAKDVMVSRAGAPKIIVQNNIKQPKVEE